MFGLELGEWSIVQELLVGTLQPFCKLYVFGSRSDNSHREFSDLDVLIFNPEENDLTEIVSLARENLEASTLGIKVDIVLEKDLAQSYKKNVFESMVEIK